MELLPLDVRATLARFPIGSQEGLGDQAKVVVKFFDPAGRYTLFVTEGRPEGKDYLFFGYCISPLGPDCDEWGYTTLKELLSIAIARGLGIERDLYFPSAVWTVAESRRRSIFPSARVAERTPNAHRRKRTERGSPDREAGRIFVER